QGVAVDYRRLRVKTDRSNFTLNPTSCEPEAVNATVRSASGASARPSDRFQAVECAALGFKPKLDLALKGKMGRLGHPALHAVLSARPGDANLKAASVALPHSVFLDQAHIGTVCTRVQFAADACPARSVYGHAKAVTPLLDKPLTGPVYLRSSNHKLPDLVMALQGPNGLEIENAARIDSVRSGIRTSFEAIPDVPISKVVLDMKGGKKGLLVNSTDVCGRKLRATAAFDAQNGRVRDSKPVLRTRCGRGGKPPRGHR
ncbi:MAG TPA: hypothetical protein VN732_06015, partial [Solirubrobacterales bacterium]|nr:hypothetical protein [Solirubrobacterales bacterium]